MKTTLAIQNLKCGGCEATIYKNLSKLKNIKDLSIDVDKSTLEFEYGTEQDLVRVQELLLKIGYPITGDANKLITKAKSYVSCAIGRVNK